MVRNIILILIVLGIVVFLSMKKNNKVIPEENKEVNKVMPEIYPIEHATFVLTWGDKFIFNDPVGGIEKYSEMPVPHFILISDIHGDHFDLATVEALVGDRTTIIAPQAVADKLTPNLLAKTSVLANNQANIFNEEFLIEAIPMYNLPQSANSWHVRGRGNGYFLAKDDVRIYIAGDTSGIPEMRALKNVDIAFMPMNLPYTMSVEEAADAVLEFKPKKVIPYHYRGEGGLSDVVKFKELVNNGDAGIEVVLLNWYKE